jgi:hypothetical protein
MISVPEARELWSGLVRAVRQMALAWPGKAAFGIPTLSIADRTMLDQLVRDDLTDLALHRGEIGGTGNGGTGNEGPKP